MTSPGWHDRRAPIALAACIAAGLGCCLPSFALAGMTMSQMKSLSGASWLDSTVAGLFARCGLPAAITDKAGAGDATRGISWRGVGMRLSAADWQLSYGTAASPVAKQEKGWRNPEPSREACAPGVAWMVLQARGRSGVLIVSRKPDGSGYDTAYRIPENLFEAHKVIGVRSGLATPIPVSILIGKYGAPDEVLQSPSGGKRYRYWVLTRNDRRPDSLHAVDFETAAGEDSSASYEISAAGTDFVDGRMALLLREWERDHVLD